MTPPLHSSPKHSSLSTRAAAAGGVALIVGIIGFAYFKLRPDLLFRGLYFLFGDGGQYLWVVDQLDRGKRLYVDIHWYYGIIPLWGYRAWAALLGNSATTYGLYTLSGMVVNAGLACWWLSRLMSLRWAVAGVFLTVVPWFVRNIVAGIHVPWEITALLLLACAWQPLSERTALRQMALGALLVMMVMIKVPLGLAGGFALFATDLVHAFGPGAAKFSLAAFVRGYWRSVLTTVSGLALYLGCLWWAIGDAHVWYDTAIPLYMIKAYAAVSGPPAWQDWEGVPYMVFNQLPLVLAMAGAVGIAAWALKCKACRAEQWFVQGGLILPLGFVCSPLSVIRISCHLYQYYWMGLLAVAICLPLLWKPARWAVIAVLLLVSSAVPYKMFFQPSEGTLRTLANGQSLWLTETEWTEWNALMKGWQAHRTNERKSTIVFEIGAGSYFYGQIPQNFRQYYYYPGFVRPYDVDWLVAHQDEFCGVLVTGNVRRLDNLALHATEKEVLHLGEEFTDDRIKLGVPDRVGERCLFLPIVPTKALAEK